MFPGNEFHISVPSDHKLLFPKFLSFGIKHKDYILWELDSKNNKIFFS